MSEVSRSRGLEVSQRGTAKPRNRETPQLIVIGGSLGGTHALRTVFCALPRDFQVPIAVVLHRHKKSSKTLPEFFHRECKLPVVDVEDKQWIKPGNVYFAPADYHLLVSKGMFNLSVDDLVRHARPSIDVLFESAADAYGSHLIAVVLTGANEDGMRGAQRVKQRGGLVVAQDPKTAEASTMPRAVIATGAVDHILRVEEIVPFLVERCPLALRL